MVLEQRGKIRVIVGPELHSMKQMPRVISEAPAAASTPGVAVLAGTTGDTPRGAGGLTAVPMTWPHSFFSFNECSMMVDQTL